MSYRDDRDADRARIEALEAELATARRQIEELEGRRSLALVQASNQALSTASATSGKLPWYGAPMRLELSRTFTGEFPRDDFESLIDICRSGARDPGRAEILKSSMTWAAGTNPKSMGPFTVVTVSIKDGRTTLLVTDSLGQLAGGVYGGFGGGIGGGAIVLPIAAFMTMPVLIPVAVVGWLGGMFLGARAIFKRAARRRAEAMQQLFETLAAEVAAKIPR